MSRAESRAESLSSTVLDGLIDGILPNSNPGSSRGSTRPPSGMASSRMNSRGDPRAASPGDSLGPAPGGPMQSSRPTSSSTSITASRPLCSIRPLCSSTPDAPAPGMRAAGSGVSMVPVMEPLTSGADLRAGLVSLTPRQQAEKRMQQAKHQQAEKILNKGQSTKRLGSFFQKKGASIKEASPVATTLPPKTTNKTLPFTSTEPLPPAPEPQRTAAPPEPAAAVEGRDMRSRAQQLLDEVSIDGVVVVHVRPGSEYQAMLYLIRAISREHGLDDVLPEVPHEVSRHRFKVLRWSDEMNPNGDALSGFTQSALPRGLLLNRVRVEAREAWEFDGKKLDSVDVQRKKPGVLIKQAEALSAESGLAPVTTETRLLLQKIAAKPPIRCFDREQLLPIALPADLAFLGKVGQAILEFNIKGLTVTPLLDQTCRAISAVLKVQGLWRTRCLRGQLNIAEQLRHMRAARVIKRCWRHFLAHRRMHMLAATRGVGKVLGNLLLGAELALDVGSLQALQARMARPISVYPEHKLKFGFDLQEAVFVTAKQGQVRMGLPEWVESELPVVGEDEVREAYGDVKLMGAEDAMALLTTATIWRDADGKEISQECGFPVPHPNAKDDEFVVHISFRNAIEAKARACLLYAITYDPQVAAGAQLIPLHMSNIVRRMETPAQARAAALPQAGFGPGCLEDMNMHRWVAVSEALSRPGTAQEVLQENLLMLMTGSRTGSPARGSRAQSPARTSRPPSRSRTPGSPGRRVCTPEFMTIPARITTSPGRALSPGYIYSPVASPPHSPMEPGLLSRSASTVSMRSQYSEGLNSQRNSLTLGRRASSQYPSRPGSMGGAGASGIEARLMSPTHSRQESQGTLAAGGDARLMSPPVRSRPASQGPLPGDLRTTSPLRGSRPGSQGALPGDPRTTSPIRITRPGSQEYRSTSPLRGSRPGTQGRGSSPQTGRRVSSPYYPPGPLQAGELRHPSPGKIGSRQGSRQSSPYQPHAFGLLHTDPPGPPQRASEPRVPSTEFSLAQQGQEGGQALPPLHPASPFARSQEAVSTSCTMRSGPPRAPLPPMDPHGQSGTCSSPRNEAHNAAMAAHAAESAAEDTGTAAEAAGPSGHRYPLDTIGKRLGVEANKGNLSRVRERAGLYVAAGLSSSYQSGSPNTINSGGGDDVLAVNPVDDQRMPSPFGRQRIPEHRSTAPSLQQGLNASMNPMASSGPQPSAGGQSASLLSASSSAHPPSEGLSASVNSVASSGRPQSGEGATVGVKEGMQPRRMYQGPWFPERPPLDGFPSRWPRYTGSPEHARSNGEAPPSPRGVGDGMSTEDQLRFLATLSPNSKLVYSVNGKISKAMDPNKMLLLPIDKSYYSNTNSLRRQTAEVTEPTSPHHKGSHAPSPLPASWYPPLAAAGTAASAGHTSLFGTGSMHTAGTAGFQDGLHNSGLLTSGGGDVGVDTEFLLDTTGSVVPELTVHRTSIGHAQDPWAVGVGQASIIRDQGRANDDIIVAEREETAEEKKLRGQANKNTELLWLKHTNTGHALAPDYWPLPATAMAELVQGMRDAYMMSAAEAASARRKEHNLIMSEIKAEQKESAWAIGAERRLQSEVADDLRETYQQVVLAYKASRVTGRAMREERRKRLNHDRAFAAAFVRQAGAIGKMQTRNELEIRQGASQARNWAVAAVRRAGDMERSDKILMSKQDISDFNRWKAAAVRADGFTRDVQRVQDAAEQEKADQVALRRFEEQDRLLRVGPAGGVWGNGKSPTVLKQPLAFTSVVSATEAEAIQQAKLLQQQQQQEEHQRLQQQLQEAREGIPRGPWAATNASAPSLSARRSSRSPELHSSISTELDENGQLLRGSLRVSRDSMAQIHLPDSAEAMGSDPTEGGGESVGEMEHVQEVHGTVQGLLPKLPAMKGASLYLAQRDKPAGIVT